MSDVEFRVSELILLQLLLMSQPVLVQALEGDHAEEFSELREDLRLLVAGQGYVPDGESVLLLREGGLVDDDHVEIAVIVSDRASVRQMLVETWRANG